MIDKKLNLVGKWWKHYGGLLIVHQLWKGINSCVVLVFKPKNTSFYIVKISPVDDYEIARDEEQLYKTLGYNQFLSPPIFSWDWKSNYGKHYCQLYNLLGPSTYDVVVDYRIQWYTIKKWIYQMIKVLRYIHHKKYIHLDIRPENILLKQINGNTKIIIEIIKNNFNENEFKESIKKYPNKKNVRSKASKKWIKKWWDRVYPLLEETGNDMDVSLLDNSDIVLIDIGNMIHYDDVKERNTRPAEVCGENYRSPEMLLDKTYDGSSDLWALGCVIYEWITGEVLFQYKTEEEQAEDFIELYDRDWIEWLKGKNIEEEDIEEISECLQMFLTVDEKERINNINNWFLKTYETSELEVEHKLDI